MRIYGSRPKRYYPVRSAIRVVPFLALFFGLGPHLLVAQTGNQGSLLEQVRNLTDSMARTQAQLQQSQQQLDVMRQQLFVLQRQMAQTGSRVSIPELSAPTPQTSSSVSAPNASNAAAAIDDLRERQAMQQSQIATHEQSKVESESKYPVKITGLLLLNGFINTGAVDMAATPTISIPGLGSTGVSLRQTVLGFTARGPHLFGARSYADLNVDFGGNSQLGTPTTSYTGYYNVNTTLLRLRTAHAGLEWQHAGAYFSLDRPIFSPDVPTSLAAMAEPALAWSGNLWTWNPQLGITHDIGLSGSRSLRLQAGLMDVGDAPVSPVIHYASTTGATPTAAEASRWPGAEARIALVGSNPDEGNHIGFGGYFAPHLSPAGQRFDAWAGTMDARLMLPGRLELTGTFYRGEALGGLGGGAFKDFVDYVNPYSGKYYFRPLDDVGGWAQLKERFSERLEFNTAIGLDNVFARELRRYAVPGGTMYQNLARNRTYTGNVIYSPSAYLLFSLEYRYLYSSPITGMSTGSNIIGIAAGYKF